ncbi:MAG: hypothetical protein J6A45_02915 [Lachnospiraceae bacterium]|nr:hypothetical protein [Lachnospiraceae bacterium]
MNGQMKRYKNSLLTMPEPIPLSKCPQIKLDLSGLMKYAKSKGMKVIDLTEAERAMFIEQ